MSYDHLFKDCEDFQKIIETKNASTAEMKARTQSSA